MKKRTHDLNPLWWNPSVIYDIPFDRPLTLREKQIISTAVMNAVSEYHEEWTVDLPHVKDVGAYRTSLENKLCNGIDALNAIGDTNTASATKEALAAIADRPVTYNEILSKARSKMRLQVLDVVGDSLYDKISKPMIEVFIYATGNPLYK